MGIEKLDEYRQGWVGKLQAKTDSDGDKVRFVGTATNLAIDFTDAVPGHSYSGNLDDGTGLIHFYGSKDELEKNGMTQKDFMDYEKSKCMITVFGNLRTLLNGEVTSSKQKGHNLGLELEASSIYVGAIYGSGVTAKQLLKTFFVVPRTNEQVIEIDIDLYM